MRKLIAPAVVSALALLLSLQPGAGAQANPLTPQGPGGAELESKARAFLQALQSLQADALFNQLAPWRQAEAELYRARLSLAAKESEFSWKDLEPVMKRLDPQGKLGVSAVKDFVALPPSELLGLHLGLYRMAADEQQSTLLKAEWFAVHRSIGLMEYEPEQVRRDFGRRHVLQTAGQVVFESVQGLRLSIVCVSEPAGWQLVGAQLLAEEREQMSVMGGLTELSDLAVQFGPSGGEGAILEGELLLSAMKNRVFVAYAKTGELPRRLSGNIDERGCSAAEDEMTGKHYKVRDTIYVDDQEFILVAQPRKGAGVWLLFQCDMSNRGNARTARYSTEAELEKAIPNSMRVK